MLTREFQICFIYLVVSFYSANLHVLNGFGKQNVMQKYNPSFVEDFKSKIVRQKYDVDCQLLLDHDDKELNRTRDMLDELRGEDGRIPILPNKNFIFPSSICDLYKEIRLSNRPFYSQMLDSQTSKDDQTSLSYTIVLHGGVEQFERFLMTVYNPNNIYCIHVDKKSNEDIQKAVKSITDCFDNVFMTTKQENVFWGGISLLKAEINCMNDLLNLDNLVNQHPNLMGKRNIQWKYLVNLAAVDFQMRTNGELLEILDIYNGSSLVGTAPDFDQWDIRIKQKYIESFIHDHVVLTDELLPPPPHDYELVQGYLHAIMYRDFVKHALTDQRALDLLEWSNGTYIPDEMFFPTILYNTKYYNESGYEKVKDPKPFDTIVRFTAWQPWRGKFRYPCKGGLWRHSLCVFSVEDLNFLTARNELIVNKFLLYHDPAVYQCLEEWFYSREGRILDKEEADFYCRFAQRHFPRIECPT